MKVLRVSVFQKRANYRIPETYKNRMTYSLVPPSTIIGAIHSICDWKELHDIKVSIVGKYESKTIEYKNLVTFLDSCMDDRGDLIKLSHPNCFDSTKDIVSKAMKSMGSCHSKEIATKVYNQQALDEYKFLRVEKEKLKNEKKDLLNDITNELKKIKSLKANLDKKDEQYIVYTNKENELKAKKEQLNNEYNQKIEEIEFQYNCFKTISTNPTYFEVLNNVYTTFYIYTSNEDELLEIYDNIKNLYCLGRSEDSVEILDYEIVEIVKPTKDISSQKNIKQYIPYEVIANKDIHTTRIAGLGGNLGKAFGTCYYLPTTYDKKDNKRIFNKVKVLLVENFSISINSKNVYYDEKNNDIVCFIE